MHWKLHSDVPAFNAPDGPPSFISEHYYRVLCLNVTTLGFKKKYISIILMLATLYLFKLLIGHLFFGSKRKGTLDNFAS